MRLVNLENAQIIAESIESANTFFKRLKGLMFRQELSPGSGIYLYPCNAIHTFFMKFPIDVLYIDKDWRIVGMEEHLQPGKVGKKFSAATSVIELESGSIRLNSIQRGQIVKLLK